jgi:hypothetical protein
LVERDGASLEQADAPAPAAPTAPPAPAPEPAPDPVETAKRRRGRPRKEPAPPPEPEGDGTVTIGDRTVDATDALLADAQRRLNDAAGKSMSADPDEAERAAKTVDRLETIVEAIRKANAIWRAKAINTGSMSD